MKVLYLHQYFNKRSSAGSIRSDILSGALEEKFHRVVIITSERGKGANKVRVEKISSRRIVIWIPVAYSNEMSMYRRVLAFSEFLLKATFVSFRVKADVVFATSTPLTIAVPAVIYKTLNQVPFVFEVRDLWPEVPIAMGIIRNGMLKFILEKFAIAIYKNADAVVALSPEMKDGVLIKSPSSDVFVIPNMANSEIFSVGKWPTDLAPIVGSRKVVLYAGTFGRVNGLDYLIDVARYTDASRVVFILVGEGSEKSSIIARAQSSGLLGRNMFIYDQVNKGRVVELFAQSSIVVSTTKAIPALWANSANKFFDAIAAHKPVAINHEGWLADLIRREHLGVVMPYDDPAKGAECLQLFLEDGTGVKTAEANAVLLAEREFSSVRLGESFVSVLERVFKESKCVEGK